ncbi:hypothetical protein KSD_39210 [Ktedonobacter sp. SOSP1-85]|uniref:hypothetical protein n=1 Tax=Ktedonobacter sp. SOSP1-85 TaxID=2778367 RepID=UPI001915D904|nr:hypothetical protein [Ktedonobacter sp. SOSP1-85]GHO76150.1 hypothetical protein KSD_39210 [Ktedonobacter sp. SOSP1-85]
MASCTKAVLVGIDTLVINAHFPQHEQLAEEQKKAKQETYDARLSALVEQLYQWQEKAQIAKEPQLTTWEHEGKAFLMSPNGTQTHYFLLKNGYIDLMMGPHLHHGAPARVRFSSEYLWRRGVDDAVMSTHMFLSSLLQEVVNLQPAEMHLCADIAGFHIPRNYERVFVSLATKWRPVKESQLDKPVYRHHRLETLQFSGHGNPLSVTIYDKPAEIEQKSREKRWFYDLWKQRQWDEQTPVWRIECRVKREALHEMDIEDVYEAIEKAPAIWAYCVGHPGQKKGWIRMVEPNTKDSNRRRWETAEAWQTVQTAFLSGWRDVTDIEAIQRERKREINLDRAEKAIAGYTTTYGAWLQDALSPDADASMVLQRLYTRMLEIWEERGVDFQTLRRQKQCVYHIS